MSKTEVNVVYKKDARKLNEILNTKIVDVTITSPPYFDLKDYGYKKQIGFGQEYSKYLEDLKLVFKNVYNCTKDTGSLWVIIDSFRRDNEVIPLPFDVSNKLREIGWKLQEIIIWGKDKTVPWAHQGQMRNLFEYILLFSKEDKYNFFIDEVRDFHSLKKWWVKYPERYNPNGKTPDGIWHFDIPLQGSWGKGFIKHFCPLPEEMIAQILKISTKEGDLVLDPFAGSGAVLAKADNMGRKYVGFELNAGYIKMFKNYLKETGEQKREKFIEQKSKQLSQTEFNSLILDLRALKYPKLILKKLPAEKASQISRIYVEKSNQKATKKNALCVIKYIFFVRKECKESELIGLLTNLSVNPPLSKFGIEPIFVVEKNANQLLLLVAKNKNVFVYTNMVTHKFRKSIDENQLANLSKSEIILSKIKVDLNEKDYE